LGSRRRGECEPVVFELLAAGEANFLEHSDGDER
jgi:hypothetical protein